MSYDSNFYYHPEKSGLTMLSFKDESLSYEFDILAFWVTQDGKVYSISDLGCSCPVPFEDYNSLEELERVGSLEQAKSIFIAWDKSYGGSKTTIGQSNEQKLVTWLKEHAKF